MLVNLGITILDIHFEFADNELSSVIKILYFFKILSDCYMLAKINEIKNREN